MNYTTYEMDGEVCETGVLAQGVDIDVPTHGSISLEVAPGLFLSFWQSEWAQVRLDTVHKHWHN